MNIKSIKDIDIVGKRVLIRVDFNVPLKNGDVVSDVRIRSALPTITYALSQNAKVILVSHLGRPIEGEYDKNLSLKPVAKRLSDLLQKPVRLAEQDLQDYIEISLGEIVLCENIRFSSGELENSEALSHNLAKQCDIFVMDAFATAHRAQASTYGVAKYAPIACAGLLMGEELKALSSALKNPIQPLAAIVGGAKVSSKLTVLENLVKKVDLLIVGGGIANTFLLAAGYSVGSSLVEKDLIEIAKNLLDNAMKFNCDIPLPIDVRVAEKFTERAESKIKLIHEIDQKDMILDIGPKTQELFSRKLKQAKTIVWNGPVGVFEFDNFGEGTASLATNIAYSDAFSVAGGGDTIAAIEKYKIKDKITYISTAGGAFLEFLEGKSLPAVEILKERSE